VHSGSTQLLCTIDELRVVRNRIHIQNVKNQLDPDEENVFTHNRQIETEKVLGIVIKHVSDKYTRPSHVNGYVQTFEIPWDEHFK